MRFAVVGHPIAHSKSPLLHRAAYDALGLSHTYEALDVSEDDFPEFFRSLKQGNFRGISVTVPHKLRAFELADEASESARIVQAANTLVVDPDGKIVAHNTDALALRSELAVLGATRDWTNARAVVLGSGGAARAAVVALQQLGAPKIVVVARNVEAARGLASVAPVDVASFAEGPRHDFDVVIQATSAGMQGADDGELVASWVDWKNVPKDAIAYDVVYAPRETKFLAAARAHGIAAQNGLGMLARQGAIAFELWLGIPAPLAAMRAAIE